MAIDKYEKYSSFYDTDHATYRKNKFINFMDLREKEFINSFRFEGDDEFTRAKQRIFLKLLFKYGYSGVVNTANLINEQFEEDTQSLINILEFDIKEIVTKQMGNKIPVMVAPTHWGVDERVVKGKGITTAYNNTIRKTYNVASTNTAIAMFDNNHKNGYSWWLEAAYMHSTAETVLKKRTALLDSKLVNNNVNNSLKNIKYDAIYDVDQSFLEMSPTQTSMAGGNEEEINVTKMLDTKLKKLDISNGESVNDLLDFVTSYEKAVMTRFGERTNINEGKSERSITEDFKSMEVHWRRLENEFKDQLTMFVEDYKNIFGVELKLVSLVDEIIEEMDEKELMNSGRGQDVKPKDNTK